MDLAKYDNLCVRVTLTDGAVYEGECTYDCEEYIVHEIGGEEDALEIAHWVFYNSQIVNVEVIGEDGFEAPYGKLEEETVADGFDFVEDVLESDFPLTSLRLLNCLEAKAETLQDRDKYLALFEMLVSYSEDKKVQEKAAQLAARWRNENV